MLAAQGYIELEMPEDALAELDGLPPEERLSEPAMQLRLFVLMRGRRWKEAMVVCDEMRRASPEGTTGYIHGAFCLHELGHTAEARQLLLSGPKALLHEPTYHYNLGCYAAVLGDTAEACQHLRRSFEMDSKFREIAKLDPDLRSVRDCL